MNIPTAADIDAQETSVSTPRIHYDDAIEPFRSQGYERVTGPDILRCRDHGIHVYLGEMDADCECTASGHLPRVRDDEDRIGEALEEQT